LEPTPTSTPTPGAPWEDLWRALLAWLRGLLP